MKFRHTSWNFILGPYCVEKIRTSNFICCLPPGKEAHPQTNHKKKIRGRKGWTFFFGKPVLFTLGQGLTSPYSLGILVSNFYQTFVTVSIECWLRFEAQIRPTGFAINFLFITARAERKVRLCVKLFYFFPRWILIRVNWNLARFSPNSVEFLKWNFGKKLFRENFPEILLKTKAILYRNSWNFALLFEILFWVRIALKRFAQVVSYIICPLVRRHVHKQITKRRYGEEKPGRFVSGEPVLFTLGLGLTTPYSLGI